MIRLSQCKLRYFARQLSFVASIAVGLIGTFGSFVRPASAVDNIWTSNTSGLWSDGGSWSLGVPADGAGITAVIDDGDSAVTVTLDSARSIDSLSLGSNDTINIESTVNAAIALQSNSSFMNAGTINLTSTDIQTAFLTMGGGAGNDKLTNTGTLNFQVGGGAGGRVFTGDLDNSGTVNVNYDAHLNKASGSHINTGQISVASGKTLRIDGGASTLNQNAGGTFTLIGTMQNSGNTFNMNDGTMIFGTPNMGDPLPAVVNGNFNYLGGNITGDVRLVQTTFTIGAGTNPETFQLNANNTLASNVGAGHTINIESTVNAAIALQSNSSFMNAGTINLTSTDIQTAFLTMGGGAGNDKLTNTGTLNFQVGGGAGGRVFTGDLDNSGTVNVNYDAHLNKASGSHINTGQISVASGKTLRIDGGASTLNQNAGGTFTLIGTMQNSGNTFNMNDGTMIFGTPNMGDPLPAVVNGNFNYLGGNITGDVRLVQTTFTIGAGTNPETFQLNANNTLASNVGAGHTINIESTVNAAIALQSNSSFMNAGTINLTSTDIQTAFLTMGGGAGNDKLTNTGTLNFQVGGGAGGRVFTGDLDNSGTVNVNYDAHLNKASGSHINTGQISVASGKTLRIDGGASTLNQNAGGTFTLIGTMQNSGNTFNMNDGTMIFGTPNMGDPLPAVVNGNFNYLGGNITGDVRLVQTTFTIGAGTNPETFQLNANNTLASNVGAGHTINIESTVNAAIALQSNSSFMNAGTINLTSTDIQTAFLTMGGGAGNDKLTNTGTLNFQVGGGAGGRVFTGDLDNSGTVNVNYDAYFNKSNGTYTNTGLIKITNGNVLEFANNGTLTNQSGTTLTGGTYDLSGNLRYAGALIFTNQAEIILRGGAITNENNHNALRLLSLNGTSGKLRVLNGVNFGAEVPIFTNDGLIELGGNIFNDAVFTYGVPFVTGQRDFINSSTGQIIGHGTFQSGSTLGTFTNSGLISPGTSPGILQIDDDYTQTATGILAIGIGNNNAQYDVLKVSDTAVLGGSLTLSLDSSFTPSINDTFTVFDSVSFTGVFGNVANGQRLTTTGGEGSFVVTYNAGIGDVILSSFLINADYNGNGMVDAADYVLWRKSPGSYGGPGGYATWRSNFGRTNLSGAGSGAGGLGESAVPEPTAAMLALVGLTLAMLSARRPQTLRTS